MFQWLIWLEDFLCGLDNDEVEATPWTPNPLFPITKEIPICGNSWVTKCRAGRPTSGGDDGSCEYLTEDGCENWSCPETIWSIFFRMSQGESINVGLRLRLPYGSQSRLRFSLVPQPIITTDNNRELLVGGGGCCSHEINITGGGDGEYQNIQVGQFHIQEGGYVKFNLQGIMRTGRSFAQVSHLLLSHAQPNNEIIFNSTQDSYFGRRGPSIHLAYELPSPYLTEYFYNEVTIPPGSDALGLYAMAIGFSGGYFGIQVNGPKERRVLFSIWSEFDTEDPGQIPEDYKVRMLRTGPGTQVGEFGNEGSGAQSYVKFTWRVGTVYKFLAHARPLDENNTLYEGWFKEPETDEWRLVAAFLKPKVSTFLTDVYSFLENFEPDQGHLERVAYYGNQWARDNEGRWFEVTRAKFTGDATSQSGRMDFAGGLVCEGGNAFYLKHCGFFSNYVPTNQKFERCCTGGCDVPEIEVENLP